MAWTQEQYDALNAAIATGTKKVTYGDKSVEYQSLGEMLRLKEAMANELGIGRSSGKVLVSTSKGL